MITSLTTLGHTIAACSFMASLSLFVFTSQDSKPTLEAMSANVALVDSQKDLHRDVAIQVRTLNHERQIQV